MKFKFLKTALLAGVLSTNVLASMPDEINFRPYRAQYLQLVDSVNQITSNLENLISQRDQNLSEQANLNQLIFNLEQENVSLDRQIRNNEAEITSLLDLNRDLEAKIQRLTDRQNRLDRKARGLNRDIDREEQRLQPIRERLQRIKRNLANKRSQLKAKQREFKAAREATEKKKSQLAKLKEQRATLKTQLDALRTKLSNIDSQIQNTQSVISTLNGNISNAESNVRSEEQRKANLDSQLASLREELRAMRQADRNDPNIPAQRSKVSAKTEEVKAQTKKVQQAKSKVKSFKNKKQAQKKKLANLKQQKTQLPSKISTKKSQLDTKRQQVTNKKSEVDRAQALQQTKKAEANALTNEVNQIEGRRTRVAERLQRESQTKIELVRELNDVNSRLDNVISRLNNTINESNRTLNRISRLEDEIPRLNSQIRANEFEINRSERNLSTIANNLNSLAIRINDTTQTQQAEIQKRDAKLAEYKQRENLYAVKLSEAQQIGVDQSLVADSIGETDSNQYVVNRSNSLGSKLGSDLAAKQGAYWASVRAENQGYLDGYNEGYASTAESNRGDEEGTLAGMTAARNYADTVLKPQFFNEIFAETISDNKIKRMNFVEALEKIEEKVVEKMDLNSNLLSGVSPLSEAEIQNSLSIETPLDAEIALANTNLNKLEVEIAELIIPENAYENPTVPFGNVNCNGVYKGVDELKAACKSIYRDNFRSLYLNSHSETFEAQYTQLAESKIQDVRNNKIESLYDQTYKKDYPVGKNAGLIVGKETIYTERFEAAKVTAYDEELPKATVVAKNKAKYEVQDWINTNATLTVTDSKLLGSELIGGMETKLKLDLKNISPVELKKPAKIVITGLQNLEAESTQYFLNAAGGSSTTSFDDIKLKVKSDVRSNQKLLITGKIILSGGKYETQRVENFSAEAVTALNPAVSSDLNYTSSPRIVTRFRSRTLVHNLNVDVSPEVEAIKAGYVVNLEVMEGSEGLIKLRQKSLKTGSLSEEQSKKLTFKYTFLLAARGKTVKLKLSYTHKGSVVRSEIIELTPF